MSYSLRLSKGFARRASVAAGVGAVALAFVAAAPRADAAAWRLQQPPPPAGVPFPTPLGQPGDLRFLGSNRGLVTVEGNATVPRGQFFFDGVGWHQLSTVCGGLAGRARIAWAGPAEFWTITEPSPPRGGTGTQTGTSLCHFQDGAVVGSYSTASTADPYLPVESAACTGPSDCWFGGVAGQDGFGQRQGGFHLHWNGSELTTEYAPQAGR